MNVDSGIVVGSAALEGVLVTGIHHPFDSMPAFEHPCLHMLRATCHLGP